MPLKIIITASIILICSQLTFSQKFDSLHVYAITMDASYYISIARDLIKNEATPILIMDSALISKINFLIVDSIKGKMIKKLKSNYIDIRLSFEFFRNGEMAKIIGVTPYGTLFMDKRLYVYKRKSLLLLEQYIPGVTGMLGIK